jgi:hypothetical protein
VGVGDKHIDKLPHLRSPSDWVCFTLGGGKKYNDLNFSFNNLLLTPRSR